HRQHLLPLPTCTTASHPDPYTLSLHDALPISPAVNGFGSATVTVTVNDGQTQNNTSTRTFTVTVNGVNQAPTLDPIASVTVTVKDRKSTRLNSSHLGISYAVFCLKKKTT